MSITQSTNWLAMAGLVVILLKLFGVEVVEADVQTVIGALVAIIGVVMNYINRYSKGDVTALGKLKIREI